MKTTTFTRTGLFTAVVMIMMFVSQGASAETLITGRIVNEKEVPVPNATATLLCIETHTVIQGDMCDEDGWFYIERVQPGKYILSFRSVGYETDDTRVIIVPENTPTIDVRTVPMLEAVILLTEVEVLARNA